MCRLSRNSGSLKLLLPKGSFQACVAIAFPRLAYFLYLCVVIYVSKEFAASILRIVQDVTFCFIFRLCLRINRVVTRLELKLNKGTS